MFEAKNVLLGCWVVFFVGLSNQRNQPNLAKQEGTKSLENRFLGTCEKHCVFEALPRGRKGFRGSVSGVSGEGFPGRKSGFNIFPSILKLSVFDCICGDFSHLLFPVETAVSGSPQYLHGLCCLFVFSRCTVVPVSFRECVF